MGKKSKYLTSDEYEYLEWRYYNGMEIDSYFEDYAESQYVQNYEDILKELLDEGEKYIIVHDQWAITSEYRAFNIKKRRQMRTNFSRLTPYIFVGGTSYNLQDLLTEQGWETKPTAEVFQNFLDRKWPWRTCYTSDTEEVQIKKVLGL